MVNGNHITTKLTNQNQDQTLYIYGCCVMLHVILCCVMLCCVVLCCLSVHSFVFLIALSFFFHERVSEIISYSFFCQILMNATLNARETILCVKTFLEVLTAPANQDLKGNHPTVAKVETLSFLLL